MVIRDPGARGDGQAGDDQRQRRGQTEPATYRGHRESAEHHLGPVVQFWRKAGAAWYLAQLTGWAKTHLLTIPRTQGRPTGSRGQLLTPRERQVVNLIAEGLTNKQIAARLTISERTAESHVEQIRGKLGVHNRAQIAAFFSGAAR